MTYPAHTLIPDDFPLAPSQELDPQVVLVPEPTDAVDAVGISVARAREVPEALGLDRAALAALGFTGNLGQILVIPTPGRATVVAVGVGDPTALTAASLRDAAAAFTRAVASTGRLAVDLLTVAAAVEPDAAVSAIVEGALLARYRYDALKSAPKTVHLERLELVGGGDTAEKAIEHGITLARATMLARDLSAAPPSHLTATRFGEYALEIGADHGVDVTVFDKEQLIELGCGGLLGVNAGSVEEPRMIRLHYRPEGRPTGHLALVGKGIMYDSGGIALKPGDAMHASMKMDMAGAAAVLATMISLRALGCANEVTAYLMCTDNMPSGSATALGDVLRIHGGTTVEVKNSDAEGRLVMADALAIAHEEGVDAAVDIATLTGAALRALGTLTAALFGNDQGIVDQVVAASGKTDETVWQLPLDRRYRDLLNSDIADIANIGGANAGATTAALFLAEFAGDTPWAHIDIAGTMQSDRDDAWRSKGPTGFGARLLIEFALAFTPTK
jgi:Leucyl aminopeptidase